jgi:Spy/CpxP family protein refolding chaperone
MRRWAGLLALALVVDANGGGLWATAQSGRGGGYQRAGTSRVAAHLRWLGEQLNLTDDQKVKLKPILMKEGQKIRSVGQDPSIPRDQKIEKVKAIHQSYAPQINEVLTPEQREKYNQLEMEAQERHRQATSGDTNQVPGQPSNHKAAD